jgi:hypothetical protein
MAKPVHDIQDERLFYLEFLALFTGQVSRKDLVSRFGISEPAATKDLSRYAELSPNMLRYDLRQKCYVLGEVAPHFTHDVEQALHSLAGARAIALDAEHAKKLPSWINYDIKRGLSLPLVATITRCLFRSRTMNAAYTSNSTGNKERLLSPVALVNDGLRWHVRCLDHSSDKFKDYNLTRFESATEGIPAEKGLKDDKEWNTEVQLKLVPHPKSKFPKIAEFDYGMEGGVKYVPLRACLVGYFLRHWHVDFTNDATGNPKAQQLFLANKNELLESGVDKWSLED